MEIKSSKPADNAFFAVTLAYMITEVTGITVLGVQDND